MLRTAILASAVLLCAACAGLERGAVVASTADFPGFPSQAKSGVVWAEGTFYANHADALGTDLLRRGVLPVALRIGRRADDGQAYRLASDFDPHLYLEDGTPLDWIAPGTGEWAERQLADRVAELGLRAGLVEDWDRTRPSFLFFRLPGGARVDGGSVLVRSHGHYRSLELAHSLLTFELTGDRGAETVHVGLTSARWTGRR